jgi:hypothetical protein
MRRSGWTPAIVPYGADQTVYLVVDRFGVLSCVYRESKLERTDLETIITDLMSGNSRLSPSTHLSIGHGTHQKISPSKSKPAATFEARASRAYQRFRRQLHRSKPAVGHAAGIIQAMGRKHI